MAYTGKINPENERVYLQGIIDNPQNPKQKAWAVSEIAKYPVLPESGNTNGSVTEGYNEDGTPVGANKMEFAYSPETMEYLEKFKQGVNTPFSYDPTTDPLYGPMKEQYTQMGRSAFENQIGRLAALTGGRASTAAIGTAAGAANQYQQQFSSQVLPELTSQAFQRHQAQRADEANLLGILMNKDTTEFDRKLAIEEFEWGRNINNPTVRGQILDNMITSFQVEHQDEVWARETREWQSRKLELDLLDKYAPELARLGYEQLFEAVRSAKIQNDKATAENVEDVPPTAGQLSKYNDLKTYLGNLGSGSGGSGNDTMDPLKYLDTYKNQIITNIGENLYNKIVNETQAAITSVPEEEKPEYSYREIADTAKEFLSKIGTQMKTYRPGVDADDEGAAYYRGINRQEMVKKAIDYVERHKGYLDESEYSNIYNELGITPADLDTYYGIRRNVTK